jgi:hypothetical protein
MFVPSLLFEPAGIGLKIVALALFVALPSWSAALLVFFVVRSLSVLMVTLAIVQSEKALVALIAYITQRTSKDWIRSTPFTTDDLYTLFGFQHFTLPNMARLSQRQLYMVSWIENRSLDCRCYFNIAGSSFILTLNTGTGVDDLPLGQRFMIYHELGHASLAGGELWNRGRFEVVMLILAIALAGISVARWPWWALVFAIGGGLLLIPTGSSLFGDEMAESFADRYSLRTIFQRDKDLEGALGIAKKLSAIWSRSLEVNHLVPHRRQLELKGRIRNLNNEIRALERLQQGKSAVDYDRLPAFIKLMPFYFWAAALFVWVYLHAADDQEIFLQAVTSFFVLLFVGCSIVRIRALRRIPPLESWILNKCRSTAKEDDMKLAHETTRNLVKELDPDVGTWLPDSAVDHIIEALADGADPETVIAEAQTTDPDNAPFNSFEFLTQTVAIVLTIKGTWDFVAFLDKGLGVILDDNQKLEIAERVVMRLKQAGLNYPAERIQEWIDQILERMTRPPNQ